MLIETENHGSNAIQIWADESSTNPRKEYDNLGTFVGFHRHYVSPDNPPVPHPEAAQRAAQSRDNICLPVWLYDHSGTCYRAAEQNPFHCPWDSGLFGFIYVSRADARKAFNVKRLTKEIEAKVIDVLKGEVETYSAWANGEVYGWKLVDSEGEEIDSCWGYIGSVDVAKEDARAAA